MEDVKWLKEYDREYGDIVSSIDGEFLIKRQINRKIARKWNVPYHVVSELSKKSDDLYNEYLIKKQDESNK